MSARERLAWKMRRFRLPVPRHALVLEVGSGGNPYPRANVLVDAYEESGERHWEPLVADRPTIIALGERLPFKDKAFDFVVAAHVLEHTPDPEQFLQELQRVATAGYIETPDAFMERINPYRDHRLEVTTRDGCLLIRKKTKWVVDEEIVDLYEPRAKRWIASHLIPRHPASFHVQFSWEHKINYRIINPGADASWSSTAPRVRAAAPTRVDAKGRSLLLGLARTLLSQRDRNAALDVTDLLRCLVCQGSLVRHSASVACNRCGASYPVSKNVITMRTSDTPHKP